MVNHTAMNSAVMEVHPVLTPERMEKRQNGRRMKEDGEPMFTLTSQDRHGVFVCEKVQQNEETMLRVRNGTKQGYDEAHVGDGISLAYPESDTRRGKGWKRLFPDIGLLRANGDSYEVRKNPQAHSERVFPSARFPGCFI